MEQFVHIKHTLIFFLISLLSSGHHVTTKDAGVVAVKAGLQSHLLRGLGLVSLELLFSRIRTSVRIIY